MAATSEAQESSEERKATDDTESEVSSTENKLKPEDLKNELDKHDLDKIDVKSAVVEEKLQEAVLEEGGKSEECKSEVSLDSSVQIPLKNNQMETSDPNCSVTMNDEINNSEEKHEVDLELSLDEEEAQLNEESLIEVSKHFDDESSKMDSVEQLNSDLSDIEKNIQPVKQSTPPKVSKAVSEDVKEKKNVKTPLSIKNAEGASIVSPKVLKVIGKNDKLKSSNILAKNLWITGLPNTTRAADLKALFSKQGKVLSVKIVKSAKQTPAKCYGIVTMATSKDATKAIQNLHRTELNGRVISVERKSGETATMLKKSEAKTLTSTPKKGTAKKEIASKQAHDKDSATVKSKEMSKVDCKANEKKSSSEDSSKKNEKSVSSEKSKDRERKPREGRERFSHRPTRRPNFKPRSSGFNDRPRFENFRRPFNRRPFNSRFGFNSSFRPRANLMDMQKLREERFQRERREDELTRHRFIERKQREEAFRLEREKEKLRIEREFLERERAEIIKLEREKQRLERERIEHEREELRRQTELRGGKRPFSRIDHEPIWEDRKKAASRYDIRPSFRTEASSSSRFEFPSRERAGFTREYDRHSQKHLDVLSQSDFANRDSRREIGIRSREDRQIFGRGDFRENRRSLSSREPERHSSTRRDAVRSEWKHDRRVQERAMPSNSSSGQRRMTYY